MVGVKTMAKIKVLVEIIEEKCGECVYSQLNPDYAACNYHGAAEERDLSPHEDPNEKYSYFIPDWCPLPDLIEIPSGKPYTRDELDFLHVNPRLIVNAIVQIILVNRKDVIKSENKQSVNVIPGDPPGTQEKWEKLWDEQCKENK